MRTFGRTVLALGLFGTPALALAYLATHVLIRICR